LYIASGKKRRLHGPRPERMNEQGKRRKESTIIDQLDAFKKLRCTRAEC
jgi:hypothetical protein